MIEKDTTAEAPVVAKKRVDLSQLDSVEAHNAGIDVELFSPRDGTPLDMFITVLGKDSDKFNEVTTAQNRARIQQAQQGGFRPGRGPVNTGEREGLELLAACTIGWKNIELDGEMLPFTTANAVKLYKRFPWIKEAIDIAIGDRALFMQA